MEIKLIKWIEFHAYLDFENVQTIWVEPIVKAKMQTIPIKLQKKAK